MALPPKTKDPHEFWTVSWRYSRKTNRPGYVVSVVKRDVDGKRIEGWCSRTPNKNDPRRLDEQEWSGKREASDYVVWWRCTHGYDERGNKQ